MAISPSAAVSETETGMPAEHVTPPDPPADATTPETAATTTVNLV